MGAPTRGAIRREKKKLNQSEADEKSARPPHKREKRKTGGGDGMARGKIDTDKREDETAVYKPVKLRKRAPSKRKRRKKRKNRTQSAQTL